ncbi:MAG: peptide-binding protein [Candidatus Omnitrophica bacterium]|nr:peptide-binding protein [Candidatus Omnitrophota bacterium]
MKKNLFQQSPNRASSFISIKVKPLLILAAFLFMSPANVFSAEKTSPRSGDAYVTGEIADARNLIPFLATDTASSGITSLVFNGLTKVDRDLNIIGDIARRWDISEDGTEITFFLKKNVRWHDGVPLTARDVKFTFETILDPKSTCPYSSDFMDIESIDVIDDYTVRFRYSKPYAPALSKLGMSVVPEHLLRGEDLVKTKFKREPVGCGPYIFKEWRTDQYIILDNNKEYFEHQPYINRCVTRVIPDMSVQYLELITGGIDSMGLTPYQYFYRTDTKAFKDKYNKYKYLSRSYSYIGYNLSDPLFQDKRVRQALSYAVDKSTIITGVLMGLGEHCTGPFFRGTPYYSEKAAAYDYDKEKALALLKDAGWADTDGDGILDKDGKPFRFKLITNQGNKDREDIATVVQRQWREIGVVADVQIIAWAAFLNEFVDKKNFQAVILGWTLPLDPDCYVVWHSASTKEGGFNFVSYKNENVDALIEEGRRTFDKAKRIEIYRKIHETIADDAPYTFLYFPYATVAISNRFEGIDPAPAGIGYNFIDWHVDPAEVRYKQ